MRNSVSKVAFHCLAAVYFAISIEGGVAQATLPIIVEETLVSIVIVNFNYGAYLATAIKSVLAQSYRRVEAIVVDDGSTDRSAALIADFGTRIRAIFQAHEGPNSARNRGYAESAGDIVMFLDADDALHPRAVEEVVRRWRAGVAKIQFCLSTVDAEGKALNLVQGFPDDYSPERVQESVLRTGSYVWPVQTGNAYARAFLDRVMPISTSRFPTALDGPLNTIAPLFGDVLTIDDILGYYRVHGRNLRIARQFDLAKFRTWLRVKDTELCFLAEWARRLGTPLAFDPRDEASFIDFRIAALRLDPERLAFREDTVPRLLLIATKSIIRSAPPLLPRFLRVLVASATLLAPRRLARTMIVFRFLPLSRPPLLSTALRLAGVGRVKPTYGGRLDLPVFDA